MAQTKLQKQIKALEYWEKEALNLPRRGHDNSVYVSSQIITLTNKIIEKSHYKKGFCALCGLEFIQWKGHFNICPFCRGTFSGITMQITDLSSAIMGIGEAVSSAAQAMSKMIAVNSTYGVK